MPLPSHTPESDFLSSDEILLHNMFWTCKCMGECPAHPNVGAAGAHFPAVRTPTGAFWIDPVSLALTAPTDLEPFSYQKAVQCFFDLQFAPETKRYPSVGSLRRGVHTLRTMAVTPDTFGWGKLQWTSHGALESMMRGMFLNLEAATPPEELFAGEYSRMGGIYKKNRSGYTCPFDPYGINVSMAIEVMAEVLRRHKDLCDSIVSRAYGMLAAGPITRTEALAKPPRPLPANHRVALIELLAAWHATTVYVDGVYRRHTDLVMAKHGEEIATTYRELKRHLESGRIPTEEELYVLTLQLSRIPRSVSDELQVKGLLLRSDEVGGLYAPSRFGAFHPRVVDVFFHLYMSATLLGVPHESLEQAPHIASPLTLGFIVHRREEIYRVPPLV